MTQLKNDLNTEMLPVAWRSRAAMKWLDSLLQRLQLCFHRLHLKCVTAKNTQINNTEIEAGLISVSLI